jgi:hypothetical protein
MLPPEQPQLEHHKAWHHRAWAAILAVATIVGLLGGILGRPWPTEPEIHPRDSIVTSTLVLPFKIWNKSLLPMENVDIACNVYLLYFIDADGYTGLFGGIAQFKTAIIPIIPREPGINYPCDASKFINIQPDGSLMLGFENGQNLNLRTKASTFRPPMNVLKMCCGSAGHIFGETLSFSSSMFQWPASPKQPQWIEGPIVPDLSNEEWIPAGSHLKSAWSLSRDLVETDSNGVAQLVSGLLTIAPR